MTNLSGPRRVSDPHPATTAARLLSPAGARATRDDRPFSSVELLRQAASEPARTLHEALPDRMPGLGAHDFSGVRVHSGEASRAAAASIGARAYTLGRDVHLGAETDGMSGRELNRLLVHEAVHSLQQGRRQVDPVVGLRVSHPVDPAEREAERIADAVTTVRERRRSSRSLALRDGMRASSLPVQIATSVSPHIQRDLTGPRKSTDGTFHLNLKTESHPGAKNGMSGTIKFNASGTAPDSTSIRLLQIARNEDLTTGKEYVWTGDEANRHKVMTTADKATGVEPGYFVDLLHAGASPRTKKTDPRISPYYADRVPGSANKHGSKKGKTVKEAALWDYPGSFGERRFSFETAAKADNTGYIYATLTWGFTISDASKGKVEKEHADAHYTASSTFGAAVAKFGEFYRNPGASTAP